MMIIIAIAAVFGLGFIAGRLYPRWW